jgi:hypothetical protein
MLVVVWHDQRGDAEMENRLNRLMRACVELDDKNPIISLHDQVLYCYYYYHLYC